MVLSNFKNSKRPIFSTLPLLLDTKCQLNQINRKVGESKYNNNI